MDMPEGQIPTPEIPRVAPPELGPLNAEASPERPVPAIDQARVQEAPPLPPPVQPIQPIVTAMPIEAVMKKQVEDIMVDGLEETYKKLDPATQAKFKSEGEQTAAAIVVMMQTTKIQVKKILQLLVAWLRIIPGVNKFFLEQEAKIKADKLLALRNQPPT
jgi:hypothetical protein